MALYLKQIVRFYVSQHMISTSEVESWLAGSGNSDFVVQTHLEIPTRPSQKPQL